MNTEFNSLPEALAAEIRQLAAQMEPQSQGENELSIGERLGQRPETVEPAISRALLQVAQASPELFASIILARLGVSAIELIECEEHSEDRLVRQNNGGYHYTDVVPFVTRKTISRKVRLVTSERGTVGRLR